MLIYRVEHSISNEGMFQSHTYSRIAQTPELYEKYRREIYNVIRNIPHIPCNEACNSGMEKLYLKMRNSDNMLFGCQSIEELKQYWLPDFNNLIKSLDECGFVLARYETDDYVTLITQVVFNKNNVIQKDIISLRSLL